MWLDLGGDASLVVGVITVRVVIFPESPEGSASTQWIGIARSGWSKIPEASIPVSILSVSESELVSADRIDT